MYTIHNIELPAGNTIMVQQDSNRLWIPIVADNIDAQEFGQWLKAGNTPTAPEGTTLPDNFVINTLATLGIS